MWGTRIACNGLYWKFCLGPVKTFNTTNTGAQNLMRETCLHGTI